VLVIGDANSSANRRVGTGTALGTCGELVQGFTSNGQAFHVTCPIEKSSTVSVTITRSQEMKVVRAAGAFDKLELAIRRTAEYLDIEPCEVRVAQWTDLETGKGMGSSTADIVAAARAFSSAVGRPLNASELASVAVSIESSDGSMHRGMVAFGQKSGALLHRYAWWPQFLIVMIVPTKVLNTESVNFEGKAALGAEFEQILRTLEGAANMHDTKAFADAATRSAELNQRFVPNAYHALLANRFQQMGAIGINVAHTGTLVGLLFDAQAPDVSTKAAAAAVEVQSMFNDVRVEMTLTPAWLQ